MGLSRTHYKHLEKTPKLRKDPEYQGPKIDKDLQCQGPEMEKRPAILGPTRIKNIKVG